MGVTMEQFMTMTPRQLMPVWATIRARIGSGFREVSASYYSLREAPPLSRTLGSQNRSGASMCAGA